MLRRLQMTTYLIERSRHLLVGKFLDQAAQFIALGAHVLECKELSAAGDVGAAEAPHSRRSSMCLDVSRCVRGEWYPGWTRT